LSTLFCVFAKKKVKIFLTDPSRVENFQANTTEVSREKAENTFFGRQYVKKYIMREAPCILHQRMIDDDKKTSA